ncbi:hypothetical protein ACIBG8_15685 [Nonomuraea sp. NPDC050556]|uniref:hypothetical protein n=1 Tax=Nonomuraea sp. NPDC050556 TaxID=3364369 RepID=UPI003797070A
MDDRVLTALRRLVDTGVLRQDQLDPVATAVSEALGTPLKVRWNEIVAYVGGALVLAAATTFMGLSWSSMSQPVKAVTLGAITVVLLAVAAVLGRGGSPVLARVAAVLAALGSGTAALTAGVLATSHEVLVGGAAGLVVAVAAYVLLPTAIGLLAAGVLSAVMAGGLAELFDQVNVLPWMVAYLALGLVFAVLALTGALRAQRVLGLGMGAASALFGAQWPIFGDLQVWGYVTTAVVALACLALYRWEHTWVLIVAGVLGLTLALPEAVWHWTGGAVGAAVILLVAGLVLLAAGGLGVLLHRSVK